MGPQEFSAAEFAAKWRGSSKPESASAQEHYLDLCRLLDVSTPAETDPSGESYTFEAGVGKLGGGQGWTDVWKREHFGWEYEGNRPTDYRQLLDYREDLEIPPALVVRNMDHIEVYTNFTNARPRIHEITLDELAAGGDQAAASQFADRARSMQERRNDPETVARFLNHVLFCLLAEDVGLLPRRLMTDLIESRRDDPAEFTNGLADLFRLTSDIDSSPAHD